MKKLRIAVFASGRGSNFGALARAAEENRLHAEICLLIAGSPDAGAISLADDLAVPSRVIFRRQFTNRQDYIRALITVLKEHDARFIALAGYMKKVPPELLKAFPQAVTNIHPALLPSFGGKGMYGSRVHQAVLDYGAKVSGATVHLVDAHYDHGPVVAQRCVPVKSGDTAASLAERILNVEHQLYPEALELFARGRISVRKNIVEISGPER